MLNHAAAPGTITRLVITQAKEALSNGKPTLLRFIAALGMLLGLQSRLRKNPAAYTCDGCGTGGSIRQDTREDNRDRTAPKDLRRRAKKRIGRRLGDICASNNHKAPILYVEDSIAFLGCQVDRSRHGVFAVFSPLDLQGGYGLRHIVQFAHVARSGGKKMLGHDNGYWKAARKILQQENQG